MPPYGRHSLRACKEFVGEVLVVSTYLYGTDSPLQHHFNPVCRVRVIL